MSAPSTRDDALSAIRKVEFRLERSTMMVLDRILRGEPLEEGDVDVVESDCNAVWRESGRRRTTTKRLAAHEAVEHFLKGSYETALLAAEYALPRKKA